ncbi:GSCOCG00005435001-RA-CDS [Cotesia congregata]|uniref:Uncharacterized protein n=1 Tax=Cotesia congregata TaxID=51543 RepID=A0A8J2MGC4_COTCN|nr:GSCOCG00005435001-RA-CDS [Cotesia congregata]CAG5078192.1 Protein of unknown function [Cotesia congregata]
MKLFVECVVFLPLLALALSANPDEAFERGYRSLYRVYEECQQRNGGLSPCIKKKAIAFFERLGRIDHLPITENLELIRVAQDNASLTRHPSESDLGRSGASRDEVLNEILLDRVANLMNGFNVQISLPKTNTVELKRSMEEGRGKMKKMMGMMMTGMAMKMAAMIPIAMGVLFMLAGKALIISKIALVLSMIIGLKKLLSQKQGGDSHGGWQSGGGGGGGGGWDRSIKDIPQNLDLQNVEADSSYGQNLAYSAHRPQQ